MVRIPILEQQQAGTPTIYASNVPLDDFTFDAEGNLYGTTHPVNTVIRIARNGTRLTIAGPEQGVIGSTAAAFTSRSFIVVISLLSVLAILDMDGIAQTIGP